MKKLLLIIALLLASPAYGQFIRNDCNTTKPAASVIATCWENGTLRSKYWTGSAWVNWPIPGFSGVTANQPVFGAGPGIEFIAGSKTGNTNMVATSTGVQIPGRCVEIDAAGNHVPSSAVGCGSASGTVTTSGSPTTNTLSKFTGATVIGNSSIKDDGAGNITFGDVTTNYWQPDLSAVTGARQTFIPGAANSVAPVPKDCDTLNPGDFVNSVSALGIIGCGTPAGGGGGTSVALDLADDAANESAGLTEIATTGDTNAIFTEPAANKLLIDLTKDWPKADLADAATALAANGANCTAGQAPLGVDASGAVESCFDVATQTELDNHVNDTSAAHAASAISADSTTLVGTGTDVQAVLEELDNAIADHLADTSAAHAGSAIANTPAGNIAATDVQAAINELDSEKLATGGTAALATALAANGANCSAGQFPLGVDASGAAESCTALPTTIAGTANQITASAATGAVTLSIPTSPTLPGTTTGTFSGNLTGNVSGSSGSTTGNAATATALAADGSNCSGSIPRGVDASGAAQGCADVDLTTEVTGTLPVANGGTGLTAGTSGGVLAYTATGTLASSGALTANLPVIGGGAGVAPSVGTRSGNTTAFVTTTGTQTSGDCVKIDASGNHIANGSACGGGSATGTWSSIGQRSANNATTPLTQFDLIADQVILWNPSDNTIVVRNSPSTVTNNVSTAGSTANGRDQAGAFSASSWIHFYWIWNGSTLASLSSTVAPMTGPTLPSGYTHWAYATSVRFNGSSNLLPVRVESNEVFYMVESGDTRLLAGGTATTFTAIDMSSLVPPNSRKATVSWLDLSYAVSPTGAINAQYRPTGSGLTEGIIIVFKTINVSNVRNDSINTSTVLTNSSQSIDYRYSFTSGTPTLNMYFDVISYFIPSNSN